MLDKAQQAKQRPPLAAWTFVALLAIIAACLVVEVVDSRAVAASGTTAAGNSKGEDVFCIAGQISRDAYGLFLVDHQRGTITMYEYAPAARKLKLVASRNYAYDLQLDDYNTEPSPREIKALVEQHRRLNSTKTQP